MKTRINQIVMLRGSLSLALLLTLGGLPYAAVGTSGLTGVRGQWPQNRIPKRVTGIRFSFRVVEVTGWGILFCFNRLSPTDGSDASGYLIEPNLYGDVLYYQDPVSTTWPMLGRDGFPEASLRLALDYPGAGQEVGVKTMNPNMFPRQTYNPDGITNLWKTDMISQTNLVGKDCVVEIVRGPSVTNLSGWHVTGNLPQDTYREWDTHVTLGTNRYSMALAFPERSAKYFYTMDGLNFDSEWFHAQGAFSIYLWDLAFQEENSDAWKPILSWQVTHHDGSLSDFGVRLAEYQAHKVLEFSSRDNAGYVPTGTVLYIGEDSRITHLDLASNVCRMDMSVPTNRFEAPNGFIVERFTALDQDPLCVASSASLTNSITFRTTGDPQAFYRTRFGLHTVDLGTMDTNLASVVMSAVTRKISPTNAIYDLDLNGIETLSTGAQHIKSLEGIQLLSGLSVLGLPENQITNVAPLTNLHSLSVVVLHDNQVADVTYLGRMPWLRELHMWNNGVTNAEALSTLILLR